MKNILSAWGPDGHAPAKVALQQYTETDSEQNKSENSAPGPCFEMSEAWPGFLPCGRQEGSVGDGTEFSVGLSFTGITYLPDRKEIIKCK